jgi:hypothetical protein
MVQHGNAYVCIFDLLHPAKHRRLTQDQLAAIVYLPFHIPIVRTQPRRVQADDANLLAAGFKSSCEVVGRVRGSALLDELRVCPHRAQEELPSLGIFQPRTDDVWMLEPLREVPWE